MLGGVLAAAAAAATALPTPAAAGVGGATAVPVTTAAPAFPPRRPNQKSLYGVPYEQKDTVRVGVIGLGNRGRGMLSGWTAVPGAVVTAVCDIRADRATTAADQVEAAGQPRPREFGGTRNSYAEMLRRDDIDFVYIASPWEFHYTHGRAALLAGKDVGVELPIALELEEIWSLVDTCERTRKHLMLMENCSYGRNELTMLKMSHEGVLGEITSGHGGYLHDLRALLFDDNYYPDAWRRKWHTRSIASFYPMHGLAPIAACMDINRGDRLTTLQATATAPKGLADYRERFVPKGHPSWKEEYINGDRITCLLETEHGRILRAEHAVSAPTPYSRINTLVGSRGTVEDYPERIYVEPDHSGDAWQDLAPLREEFDHWLWKTVGDDAEQNGGHGGIDYILQWRIVQQIRTGDVPDIDIYDSAAWCSAVPLSKASLEANGRPVAVPDLTRGRWSELRLGLDSVASDMPS